MPDMTNITDFDPATGKTTTTLVSTHDRGAQQEAARDGQGHGTWHRNDAPSGAPKPVLTSITPTTALVSTAITVTANGTNLTGGTLKAGSTALVTTVVSDTQLTAPYTTPAIPQTMSIAVQHPDGGSNWLPLLVTLTMDDPSQYTVDEIKAWVDDHADQADEILAAEQGRGSDARSTLITWLEGFIAHRDED